jgi:hypothetical protein
VDFLLACGKPTPENVPWRPQQNLSIRPSLRLGAAC